MKSAQRNINPKVEADLRKAMDLALPAQKVRPIYIHLRQHLCDELIWSQRLRDASIQQRLHVFDSDLQKRQVSQVQTLAARLSHSCPEVFAHLSILLRDCCSRTGCTSHRLNWRVLSGHQALLRLILRSARSSLSLRRRSTAATRGSRCSRS